MKERPWTVPEGECQGEDFVTQLKNYLDFSRDTRGFLKLLREVQNGSGGALTRRQFVGHLKQLNGLKSVWYEPPAEKKAKLTCSQQSEEEEEEEEEEEHQSSSSAELQSQSPEEEDEASPEPAAVEPELPGQKEAETEELRLSALESQCDLGTSEVSSSTT